MRVYAVNAQGEFVEYKQEPFGGQHTEKAMEDWLEANPDAILEEGGLLIIGRQVTTNLSGGIDLLGVDRQGDVVVVELKRDRTPRETLAQALEYASFVEQLDYVQLDALLRSYTGEEGTSLAEVHRMRFGLGEDEAVSFNKDQRVVIVGGEITPAIRQTSVYLRKRGLRVTCLEFSFFQSGNGERLVSFDVAVGQDAGQVGTLVNLPLPKTSREPFLAACDGAGQAVHSAILDLANEEGLPIHWGVRGYSLNVNASGEHINLGYGYPKPDKAGQTKQGFYTAFSVIEKKVADFKQTVEHHRQRLYDTGLFGEAGKLIDIRYLIEMRPTEEQIAALLDALRSLAREVKSLAEGEVEG